MSAVAAVAGTFFTVLIVYLLVKNVGTSAKPASGLGEISGAVTTITGDITK
jgi:hypothetical protein